MDPVVNLSKSLQDVLENNGLKSCFQVPKGTTAQRPTAPKLGQLRWSTTGSQYEYYNGASWASLQLSNATLTAFGSYNTAGLMTQTAANTFTGRTVTGTANTITMTNGNGVAGNPTITIADNAVLPGTAGVTLPTGTTGQRGSTDGQIRYNTTVPQLEVRISGAWHAVNVT